MEEQRGKADFVQIFHFFQRKEPYLSCGVTLDTIQYVLNRWLRWSNQCAERCQKILLVLRFHGCYQRQSCQPKQR